MDLNGLIGPRTGSRINKQLMLLYGSIAKLVIALPCHGRDHEFESRQSRSALFVMFTFVWIMVALNLLLL